MEILIKELRLSNFMGAKEQTIDFSKTTEIRGDNATGKTRIFNAFTWLLFGKDSEDNQNFAIKAVDPAGEPRHNLDNTVSAVLFIDGAKLELERTYREKWVKRRGEEKQEFAGHETLFKVNNIPYKQGEFQDKIKSLLNEDLFKLLTNPFFFNINLKWSDRREMLFKLLDPISDEDLQSALPELKDFLQNLQGQDITEKKKQVAAKLQLLRKDQREIPIRIDEATKNLKDEPDYLGLEAKIKRNEEKMASLEEGLQEKDKRLQRSNEGYFNKRQKLFDLQKDHQRLLEELNKEKENFEAQKKMSTQRLHSRKELLIEDFRILENQKAKKLQIIGDLEAENKKLREDWKAANSQTFFLNPEEKFCPLCKRPFDQEEINILTQELEENFNLKKAKDLQRIEERGQCNKKSILALTAEVAAIVEKLNINKMEDEKIRKEFAELPADFVTEKEKLYVIEGVAKDIQALQDELVKLKPDNDDEGLAALRKEISDLYQENQELLTKLGIRRNNEQVQQRIEALTEDQIRLGQEVANLEKEDFAYEKIIRTRASLLEDKVNKFFRIVKFRLFEELVNGGLQETCEALIEGVPFPSANNAAKINAGLDIINTFSEHFNIYVPIFTDNAEAVNELLPVKSQMIKLFVTKDPEIKVINN